jgi:hypothetical protein
VFPVRDSPETPVAEITWPRVTAMMSSAIVTWPAPAASWNAPPELVTAVLVTTMPEEEPSIAMPCVVVVPPVTSSVSRVMSWEPVTSIPELRLPWTVIPLMRTSCTSARVRTVAVVEPVFSMVTGVFQLMPERGVADSKVIGAPGFPERERVAGPR